MSTPNLAPVDIAIVVGFLVLVTVIGFAMSKAASESADDYFLGGNKIPWWVLGISTATSNFDMAGTMIIVAVVSSLGYKGFLVEIRGGVGLTLAFLLVFLGKWLRRSRVMTSAEWMKLRFGTDRPGRAAHITSAAANLILSLGMIIYFCKGAGKFLTTFIPLSEFWCTAGMVAIGLAYTLLSGLYGVVFTDVVQMILLTFTALFVTVHAWTVAPNITFPEGFLTLDLESPGQLGAGLLAQDPGQWEPILGLFGLCVMLWFFRTALEGMGGVGGYTDQRFFAARSEREASLLTLESIVLSVFRWTMVAGLVVLGLQLVQSGSASGQIIAADPEQVLPIVLAELLPAGIKGLVLAGLIAAAMSTFDSTLNAGASYLVKDIYQDYIKPTATNDDLVRASRIATVALCVAGVGLAAMVKNINSIWGLLTMGIGAGMFVPSFLRWYWPRFNGYGFAAGTGGGLLAALVFNAGINLPLYYSFPAVVASAFVASVVATYVTAPTADAQLVRFYMQINPWGFWRRYASLAEDQGLMSREARRERLVERVNDVVALCFALPFQFSMLLAGMAFVFHDWKKFSFFTAVALISAVGLYFFWWRNLKSEAECAREDELYGKRSAAAGH